MARVAVIGCGHWGKNLVRNFAELGSLAAVCDADAERARHLGAEHGASALSWEAVLGEAAIDAVAIAAPAPLHHPLARQALEAGKHVFVEKPLALTAGQAQDLIAVSRDKGRTLMVGHLLHYHPAFVALKGLVASGRLGTLRYVHSRRLSAGQVRAEEDVLWSFAPHDFSMVLALMGADPEGVEARGAAHITPGIADYADVHMAFPGGAVAKVSVSWLYPEKEHRLVVVGEGGMAVFDDTRPLEHKLALYAHRVEEGAGRPTLLRKAAPEYIALEAAEPLRAECAHFLHCADTGQAPLTGGQEGLRVVRLLERAQASMAGASPLKNRQAA
jgi:UDP-2-acetamido-3-amino-2,3-dideoxy-glucuronate N-acetyltransferase